eukprot:TRINITY_DN5190_c0_g1_i1.p1 TRINITY_DN5190_c0_g1~~TRINITY_DN5190_c0_g1_i1.p1  ORF type:complete len:276 (-),score=67.69 TRINITY_DN5190_c0_g1_i1:63-890(-)
MRLRAKIAQIDLFLRVVQTVEKISKECVVFLTPKKIQLILTSDNVTDGVQVWSGANVTTLFEEYKIESLNNNEISFKINLDNLQKALKSAQKQADIIMKLTKRDGSPFLNFTICTQTAHTMTVDQSVPVELLSAVQISQYVEPHLPDPEVHIMMPPLKSVRGVVDHMKNISDNLIIFANMSGELTLKVEESMVSVATFYKNLEHPAIENRTPPKSNPNITAEVKVDIKKFSRFLYSYQVLPSNVICCIVKDRAVVLHVLLDDLYLTYYVPVITRD